MSGIELSVDYSKINFFLLKLIRLEIDAESIDDQTIDFFFTTTVMIVEMSWSFFVYTVCVSV